MKKITLSILSIIIVFITGCAEEESRNDVVAQTESLSQGWHFQGRDCLACHNVDLQDERHLVFAGTIYKNENEVNTDDLNNVCGGELFVELLNPSRTKLLYSSKNYIDPNSKGNRGKGNIFILQRMFSPNILTGKIAIEIADTSGNVLTSYIHEFSGEKYDPAKPIDRDNRISCNSCHAKDGLDEPIYIDSDKTVYCK